MANRDDLMGAVQHPIQRILEVIGELKDATRAPDRHDQEAVDELWATLESLIAMVLQQKHTPDLLHKAALYDRIAAMIHPYIRGLEEMPNVDPDAEDRGGDRDRGSDQS